MPSLTQRNPDEAHRASTPLELFVDLATVIAIAAAALGLHHGISENHTTEAILTYLFAFGAVWWAWLNYSWFASAYDDGSPFFRMATCVFLAGALVLAAGIREFVETHRPILILSGYLIMRTALVAFWLAASGSGGPQRRTCLSYAAGITVTQIYWILLLTVFWQWGPAIVGLFLLGMAAELAVPYLSERAGPTPWHRHHMIERYGLLNIIVLGEMLLAVSGAIYSATEDGAVNLKLIALAVSGICIAISMWWVYFCREDHLQSRDPGRTFVWGYGHVVIFAGAAATGAGFGVMTDILTDHAEASAATGAWAIALPVAAYFLGLWAVRDRFHLTGGAVASLPVAGLACLATPFLPWPVEAVAVISLCAAVARASLTARSGQAA